MDALRTDPRVCFLVEEVGPQVTWRHGCGISQIYESVMCFGKAEIVEEVQERKRILERMINKFVPVEAPAMKEGNIPNTAVVRIRIEWMTGKANRLNPEHTLVSNRFKPQ